MRAVYLTEKKAQQLLVYLRNSIIKEESELSDDQREELTEHILNLAKEISDRLGIHDIENHTIDPVTLKVVPLERIERKPNDPEDEGYILGKTLS